MSPWFIVCTSVQKGYSSAPPHASPPASQSAESSLATSEVTEVTARSPQNPVCEPQLRFSMCPYPQGIREEQTQSKENFSTLNSAPDWEMYRVLRFLSNET